MTKMKNYLYDKVKYIKFGIPPIVLWISYEAYRTKRLLCSLVHTNALEIDKKNPADFIYIKHSIYRETINKLKRKNELNTFNIFIAPFEKWWKKMKHSIAWRLVRIAQTGNHRDRLKAINQLALINHLKDWDFQHLAQICDARTAVSLARCDSDPRWFIPPKLYGVKKTPKEISEEIRLLLKQLTPSKCVDFFLHTIFDVNIEEPDDYIVEYRRYDAQLLQQCLELLLHLSSKKQFCEEILTHRGLDILIEMEKNCKHDISMKLLLSKIISNLSVCANSYWHFHVTGWLHILSQWKRNNDMRLNVTASVTLANLDLDDPHRHIYGPNLFLLHPRTRPQINAEVDIVFIHGLLGSVFITWRQKEQSELKEHKVLGKKSTTNTTNLKNVVKNISLTKSVEEFDIIKTDKEFQSVFYDNEIFGTTEPVMKMNTPKINSSRLIDISEENTTTLETLEALKEDEGLDDDWEVVFPDVPLLAHENEIDLRDRYSIPGSKWTNEGSQSEYTFCWPLEWLKKDYPYIRVIGMNYESFLSQWSSSSAVDIFCPCSKNDGKLINRSAEFLKRLADAGVGYNRPVVWVGHSMGGLLIKSIIVQALNSDNEEIKRVGANTRAIYFLGTPHKGSSIAKLKPHIAAILWPSVEVVELEENAKYLIKLHENFIKSSIISNGTVEIVSVAENNSTILPFFKIPIQIVTSKSAHIPAIGDFYLTNDDHLGISKPICRQSFLYQRLIKMIDNAIACTKPLKIEKQKQIELKEKAPGYTVIIQQQQ